MTFRPQCVTSRLFLKILLNFGYGSLWRREAVLSFRKMLKFRSTLLHLNIIPWKCGQQVLWKSPCIYYNLRGVTSQKGVQFCNERTSVLYLLNVVGTWRRTWYRRGKPPAYKQPRLSCRMKFATSFLCGVSNISRMNVIVSSLLMKTGSGHRAKLAAKEYLAWS